MLNSEEGNGLDGGCNSQGLDVFGASYGSLREGVFQVRIFFSQDLDDLIGVFSQIMSVFSCREVWTRRPKVLRSGRSLLVLFIDYVSIGEGKV